MSLSGDWCGGQHSHIELSPHLESVLFPFQRAGVRQLLAMLHRQGGALLADDVGLGKSVQAMAVAVVLGRSVALIVPAALRPQWRAILEGQGPLGPLGLDATIVTHSALSRGDVSAVPRGALLIVDEAHQFRTRTTKRHKALRELCVSRPVLLLSATPVHNSVEDLRALLSLFLPEDRRLYRNADGIGALATSFGRAVVRRARSTVRADRATSVIEMPDYGLSRIAQLELAAELAMGEGEPVALCLRVLLARAASGPAALDDTLARLCGYLRRAVEAAGAGQVLGRAEFLRLFGDDPELQCAQQVFPFLYGTGRPETPPDVDELSLRLRALSSIASKLRSPALSGDPRLEAVLARCDKSVLAFSRYRRTAEAFAGLASGAGVRTALWHGGGAWLGGTRVSPVELLNRFRVESAEGALVVATEVASQGLDLPFVDCILHLDLPWSPATLQQRNGRADRLQRAGGFEVIVTQPPRDIEATLLGGRAIARKSALQSLLFADSDSLASIVHRARGRTVCGGTVPSIAGAPVSGAFWAAGEARWLVRIGEQVDMFSLCDAFESGDDLATSSDMAEGVRVLSSLPLDAWTRLPDAVWRRLHLVHLVLDPRRSPPSPYLDESMASWLRATGQAQRSGWLRLLGAPLPSAAESARARWLFNEGRFAREVDFARLPDWALPRDRGWPAAEDVLVASGGSACRFLFVGGSDAAWVLPWIDHVTAAFL